MSRLDPYRKTYVESTSGSELSSEIGRVSESIRSNNLYSGPPRNSHSEQAIAQSLMAMKVAAQLNDRRLLAEASRTMAHGLNAAEQYEQSIEHYRHSIALFEVVGAGEQAARTRLGFMAALYTVGKYDEALDVASKAEQWFRANNHKPGLAKVFANLGNLYYRREQHQMALQHHRKALLLFEELQDWSGLAVIYLNLGNCLCCSEQLVEAGQMYRKAENISQRLGMQSLLMQVRYNHAYLMFLVSRYPEALELFASLREYFSKTGSQRHISLCDLDVAEVYLHIHKPGEAVTRAGAASKGFSELGMPYEEAKALAFSCIGLVQTGRLDEAKVAATASRSIFEREKNRYWFCVVDSCLTYIRLESGAPPNVHDPATQAKLRLEKISLNDSLALLESMAMLNPTFRAAGARMSALLKLTLNKHRVGFGDFPGAAEG